MKKEDLKEEAGKVVWYDLLIDAKSADRRLDLILGEEDNEFRVIIPNVPLDIQNAIEMAFIENPKCDN
jgi:hypothetical protein